MRWTRHARRPPTSRRTGTRVASGTWPCRAEADERGVRQPPDLTGGNGTAWGAAGWSPGSVSNAPPVSRPTETTVTPELGTTGRSVVHRQRAGAATTAL